ncbi:hypothetical protein CHELA40_10429 [Chelatococcus asaccharovorans]|nr:hypothetical protein CHELA40_10429 [Chelatococcus asaccharovorans]CAH1686701.1 hypothetical protein CHELA17_65179 [Chelatococcus asaccharovorans]
MESPDAIRDYELSRHVLSEANLQQTELL